MEEINVLIVLHMICKPAVTSHLQGTRPLDFIICQLSLKSAHTP